MGLTRLVIVTMLVLSGAHATAQRQPARGADVIEEELEKKQRELAESESRLNRLQELRMRLGLGLPIRADRYFKLTAEQAALVGEVGPERLLTEESEVQRLSMQASALAEQCDQARANLHQQTLAQANPGSTPNVNAASDPTPRVTSPPTPHQPVEVRDPHPDATPAELIAATNHRPTPRDPSSMSPGSSKLIVGSRSRGDVGRVLLRSAESVMRRAQREADADAAAKLLERATELLEAAKRELDPLAKSKQPRFIDLYHLARCEEKLGNSAAADSLYAQIISLDQTIGEDGTEHYGKWGRAAQAAKSVLRWISDEGNWQPTRDIDSIRWDDN